MVIIRIAVLTRKWAVVSSSTLGLGLEEEDNGP